MAVKNSNEYVYMGLNGFVWWFGIVENRADPLNVGRCQVRIFAFHPENTPTKDLPWAHPVIPVGYNTPTPPPEGTQVFGFFADGETARFPIILGVVPSIPDLIPGEGEPFTDPFTAAQKAASDFPRKIDVSKVSTSAAGPEIEDKTAQRNPGLNLNEPTTSRLARPDRIESPETGESLGVRSASIANTSIDIQRKNRLKFIKTAKEDEPLPADVAAGVASTARRQVVWNEPFPSYNAKYPFNHVIKETESGHSFEMDDTKDYERVQLSHRTGSTLEFLPSGSVKQKAFNHKYDVTMGDHKEYVGGDKVETVQGGMFLRINGKLVIQADEISFESAGDINMKGDNIKITADNKMDLFSVAGTNVYGAAGVDIRSEGVCATYGGKGATHSSGGLTTISGTYNPIADAVRSILEKVLPKDKVDEIGKRRPVTECGVKIQGPNMFLNAAQGYYNTALTNIVPLAMPTANPDDGADVASKFRAPIPRLKPTTSTNKREPTDGLGAFEREFSATLDTPDALKVAALTEDKLQAAANTGDLEILQSSVPQFNDQGS